MTLTDGQPGLRLAVNVSQFYMEGFSGVIHVRVENPTVARYDRVAIELLGDVPAKDRSFDFALDSGQAKERRFQLGRLTTRGSQVLGFKVTATAGPNVQAYRADLMLHVLERVASAKDISLHAGDLRLGDSSTKFNIGGVINIDVQNKIDQGQIKTANELMTEIGHADPLFKPLDLEPMALPATERRKGPGPWVALAAVLILLLVAAVLWRGGASDAISPAQPSPASVAEPRPPEIPTDSTPEPSGRADTNVPATTVVTDEARPVSSVSLVPGPSQTSEVAVEKTSLAVMPFRMLGDAADLGEGTGVVLSEAFLAGIDGDRFDVREPLELESLARGQTPGRLDAADDPGRAVALGRLAGVQYIVLGSLGRVGTNYHLSARLVDCRGGMVTERGWVSFASINAWPSKVPELLRLLGLQTSEAGQELSSSVHRFAADNDLLNAVNAPPGFTVRIYTADGRRTYTEGEYISFVVEATQDCYVTLITVDSAGQMTLLLPNAWQKSAFVRQGQKVQIPSPEAGFRFPIQPPHGETLVKAIATVQPLVLSGVTTKSLDEQRFITLPEGAKAIGLEGAPDQTSVEGNGPLSDLFGPEEWSTNELIIVTRGPT